MFISGHQIQDRFLSPTKFFMLLNLRREGERSSWQLNRIGTKHMIVLNDSLLRRFYVIGFHDKWIQLVMNGITGTFQIKINRKVGNFIHLQRDNIFVHFGSRGPLLFIEECYYKG